jgi:hypothetical protein
MSSQTSDWYEIETVLKRRRLKGGDEFLVKWKNYEQNRLDSAKRFNIGGTSAIFSKTATA